MLAIFKREFKAYFTSPVGYVVLTLFLVFSGYFFSYMYAEGYPYTAFVFTQMFTIVMFAVPILTMKLMSDDKRQKTDQALLTAPVKLSAIVLGKFFAALCFFLIGFAETLVFQIIIAIVSTADWATFFGNVVGIILFGSSLIAIGIFISALTESQVVAAISSFAVSLFLILMDTFAQIINVTWVTTVVGWVSFSGRYTTFTEGIMDFANVIFFLSFAALFLFLTVRVLEKKRYS